MNYGGRRLTDGVPSNLVHIIITGELHCEVEFTEETLHYMLDTVFSLDS